MPADESGCQSWAAHEPGSKRDSKEVCLCVTTTNVLQPYAAVLSVCNQHGLIICYATAICGSQRCTTLLYRGESCKNERHGSRAQVSHRLACMSFFLMQPVCKAASGSPTRPTCRRVPSSVAHVGCDGEQGAASCNMNDGGIRRSDRARRHPTLWHDVYSYEDPVADEAGGLQPTAELGSPGRSDDTITGEGQLGRRKVKRRRFAVSQQGRQQAIEQHDEQVPLNEQHGKQSGEASETQLVVSTAVQESRGDKHEAAAVAKVKKTPTKRKKTKYDPAPMKAVAERAQDILEPVSQTLVPTAVNPCAALNCRPSAPMRCDPSPTPSWKVLTGTCSR